MRAMRTSIIGLVIVVLVLMAAGCSKNEDNTTTETGKDNATTETDKNNKNPIVTLEMASGVTMEIELYPDVAPITVTNFVNLVSSGFYDGLIFHRIIPDFMIQGGDPDGNGTGGPGYEIIGEFKNNGYTNMLSHKKGIISMAREGQNMDSAGSQFFIMTKDTPFLDGDYAAFGKVVKGIEALDALDTVPTGTGDKPLEDQVIKKMTVDTKGVEYGETKKVTP